MLRNKSIFYFLIKAIIIYAILSLPISFYDALYGAFYRNCCNRLFAKIDDTGFANFKAAKGAYDTQINIGNYKQVSTDNKATLAVRHVNAHYSGFLPTALFISLLLATPIPLRRKAVSFIFGFVLVTCFIMLKQWILLINICQNTAWLDLYELSEKQLKLLDYFYPKLIPYLGTSWFFVVVIWLLVSFKRDDLQQMSQVSQS